MFIKEIHFLGFNISSRGIGTIAYKVKSIIEWKRPGNLKKLRSFLGVGSYYRRFIKDYTRIISPLLELTKTVEGGGIVGKRRSMKSNTEWNDKCEVTMENS